MGRNTIGGKQYKKTKQSSEAPKYQTREHDQQWARIIRILGNRNTLAYCNDNVIRLCHIRGAIRKNCWISVGDIVLISLRDFGGDTKNEKADILYKYERDFHSKLKKEESINPKLFLQLEISTEENLNKLQTTRFMEDIEEDLFEDTENKEDEEVDIDNI